MTEKTEADREFDEFIIALKKYADCIRENNRHPRNVEKRKILLFLDAGQAVECSLDVGPENKMIEEYLGKEEKGTERC